MTTANPLRPALSSPALRDPIRLKRMALGVMLATALAAGPLAGPTPARAEPPELTGAAWAAADRAYAAQRDKKYSETVTYAREALKLRPDVARLWLLLMDALEAQDKTAEAVAAGNQAIAAGITDQTLVARVRAQSKILAQAPSLAANKALEKLVAAWLGVPASTVAVTAGATARLKTVRVSGNADALVAAIAARLGEAD